MFIVPLGIEAKTVHTPWATFAVVIVISFTTILNRSLNDQLNEIYLHSQERQAYQRELKSYLDQSCVDVLRPGLCDQFQRSVLPEHLMSVEIFRAFQPQSSEKESRELLAFVRPWLDEARITQIADNDPKIQILKTKLQELNLKTSEFVQKHAILGTQNLGPWTVLKSQFLHSGFMHLMGNLVFLLLLAFPVEQRLGWMRYLGVYFLAGFFGMAMQAWIGGSSVMIVGASANVFGVAGAFLALFLRERMRILVSFFMVNNQTVLIPVVGYFGFWIVGEELLGLLRSSSDGIAHWAHMGGFGAGFVAAKFLDRHPRLPEGLVYPYEKEFIHEIENATDDETKIASYTHWLHVNPASERAAFESLEVIQRLLAVGLDSPSLNQFYRKIWPDLFDRHLRKEKFLENTPVSWLADRKRPPQLSVVGEALSQYHREQKYWCEWLLLYHVAHTASPLPLAWDRRLDELNHTLAASPTWSEKLRELSSLDSALKKFIDDRGVRLNLGRGHAS